MELGSNFAAKLEPFLLMSKSAKGAAAAKLIENATSAPGVFVFAELLELPNIQELQNHEQHSKHYSLLEVFSYKTYQDYIQKKDFFPPLNAAQTTKLKHLSIVTLTSERRILPYSLLLSQLQMPSIRELEDLIIDAIYLDILRGKLDQKEQQLEVEYTMGRDLEPGKIENVLTALNDWVNTTSTVLSTLDAKLTSISSYSAASAAHQAEHEKALQSTLKDVIDRQKEAKFGRRGGAYALQGALDFGGGGGREREMLRDRENMMDVDEDVKGKNRKAPQEKQRVNKRNRT